MKYSRKLIATALCAVLAVSTVTGCQSTGDGPREGIPLGRYIEEQWELPEAEQYPGIVLEPDGAVGLLTYSLDMEDPEARSQQLYYRREGDAWVDRTPDWMRQLQDAEHYIASIHYNSGGQGVVVHSGPDLEQGEDSYTYHISLLQPDGTLTPTPIGKIPQESASGSRTFVISRSDEEGQEEGDEGEFSLEPPQGPGRQILIESSGDDLEAADEAVADALGEDTVEQATTDASLAVNGGEEDDDALAEDSSYTEIYAYFQRAILGEDGTVYASDWNEVARYDPETGRELVRYEQESYSNSLSFALHGGDLVQGITTGAGSTLVAMEAETGIPVQTLDADAINYPTKESMALFGDDSGLYVANGGGLYHLSPGGESWERLVEGSLTSLSLPSASIDQLMAHGEGEFLVLYGGARQSLMNYRYSADTPSRPDTELTIYTMNQSRSLQQAVGAYRALNPNVLVNIDILVEPGSGATGDDALRALNTELLAGNGPDLMVLDNLPYQSYRDKGILEDIADVVLPLVDSGTLLPGVAGSMAESGKVYAVPTRFYLPTLWGDADILASGVSLSDIASYAEGHPEERMFANLSPGYLITAYAPVHYNSWFDGEQVDTAALADFLTQIKRLSDTAGEEKSLYDEEEDTMGIVGNSLSLLDGHSWYDVLTLGNRQTQLMAGYLRGFESILEPNGAVFARTGRDVMSSDEEMTSVPDDEVRDVFRLLTGEESGVFVPSTILGVNAASSQKDLAREFVKAVLDTEAQSIDLGEGFPVNRVAIEEQANTVQQYMLSYGNVDEDTGEYTWVAMGWPSHAMRWAVADTLDSVNIPVFQDHDVLYTIITESEAFFNGAGTAQDAAERVAQSLRLMFAE